MAMAEHWTLDSSRRPYFRFAALISGVCFLIGAILNSVSLNRVTIPLALGIAGGLLGVLGAVSVLFLWLSMLSYWWQVYRTEHGTSWFWLAMLVLGNWVGALIFYCCVFRQIARRRMGECRF